MTNGAGLPGLFIEILGHSTLTAHGDRTEMIFHLRGFAGYPGDQYVYDGWSNTLDDLLVHLHNQKQ